VSPARLVFSVLEALRFHKNALLLLVTTARLDRLFQAVPRAMPDTIVLVAQLTRRHALLHLEATVRQDLQLLLV